MRSITTFIWLCCALAALMAVAKPTRGKLGGDGTNAANSKPYDAEVEYVRLDNSSGGSYGTGIFIDDDYYTIECDCKITKAYSSWGGPYSAYVDETTECTRVSIRGSYITGAYAGYRRRADSQKVITSNDWTTRALYSLSFKKLVVVRKGVSTEIALSEPSSTVARGLELALTAKGLDIYYYRFRILHNADVLMDLRPVRKGDVGYLYDAVSGKLIGSWGSVPFLVGPDQK